VYVAATRADLLVLLQAGSAEPQLHPVDVAWERFLLRALRDVGLPREHHGRFLMVARFPVSPAALALCLPLHARESTPTKESLHGLDVRYGVRRTHLPHPSVAPPP
jgi:hypothetical protein